MIHEANGLMVKDFATQHEEKVHLIIVREGLDTFAHLHPQIDAAGQLTVSYTFPSGGTYRLYADYQPSGKPHATAMATIQVRGENLPTQSLRPNAPGRILGDGLNADVVIERRGNSGDTLIRFELFDAAGQPISDLRPYLGAAGHLVVISRDGQEYVHAHPQVRDPHEASNTVVFLAQFQDTGLYKGWGQFRRGAVLHTVPFVVEVR
jgi:hypothetical protein